MSGFDTKAILYFVDLFCLDSAALIMLNEQQFDLFREIQTSQIGGLPYNDTSLDRMLCKSFNQKDCRLKTDLKAVAY